MVTINKAILHQHPYLDLSVRHAGKGTYPMELTRNRLAVNRSLWVYKADGMDAGYIKDLTTHREYRMKAGHVYFIPYDLEIMQELTDRIHFVTFQFSLSLINGVDVFGNYGRCEDIAEADFVTDALDIIDGEKYLFALCRVNELLFRLVTILMNKQPEAFDNISPDTCKEYEPAIRYLNNYCDATTTVKKLAELCRMRQDVFSRCFTRDMKITPKAFITSRVIRKASEMLLKNDAKVSVIADEMEFSSEYFFYRFFKKHTGMTPGQFRKLNGMV